MANTTPQVVHSLLPVMNSVLSHSHEQLKLALAANDVTVRQLLSVDTSTDPLLKEQLSSLKCACAITEAGRCLNNVVDGGELTLLHCAVLACNVTACQLLISHDPGCLDMATPGEGYTALHLASDMYSCVSAHGRSADTDKHQTSPCRFARDSKEQLNSLEGICRLLCAAGSDVNMGARDGERPLHVAEHYVMEMLIQYGCDLNVRTKYGYSKLMMSVRRGQWKIVQKLTSLGCDVNLQNRCWSTALMLAVQSPLADHERAVRTLLAAGAEVNRVNNSGQTALILAAESNCLSCTQLMLDNNADVDSFDSEGQTPLSIFASSGNTDGVKLVLQKCPKVDYNHLSLTTPLWEASHAGHLEVVRLLLLAKADINATNRNDEVESTPVVAASLGRHLEIVSLLLRAGCCRRPLKSLLDKPTSRLTSSLTSTQLDFLHALCGEAISLRNATTCCIRRQLQRPVLTVAWRLPLPRTLVEDVLLL